MITFDCPKQFSVATVTFLDIFDVFRHEVDAVLVYFNRTVDDFVGLLINFETRFGTSVNIETSFYTKI